MKYVKWIYKGIIYSCTTLGKSYNRKVKFINVNSGSLFCYYSTVFLKVHPQKKILTWESNSCLNRSTFKIIWGKHWVKQVLLACLLLNLNMKKNLWNAHVHCDSMKCTLNVLPHRFIWTFNISSSQTIIGWRCLVR